MFNIIIAYVTDLIYVATTITSKRLGRYTSGINMETFSVRHLVVLWNCTYFVIRLELGTITKRFYENVGLYIYFVADGS